MKTPVIPFLIGLMTATSPASLDAQGFSSMSDIVRVDVVDGWRTENGTHIAALRMRLASGWKTYWRAPGEGGLPTMLDWGASENLSALRIMWPRPQIYDVAGLQSFGYHGVVILPFELTPNSEGDIDLNARLDIGICKEVCVPATFKLNETLHSDDAEGVEMIKSVMATEPMTAKQAGVQSLNCEIEPTVTGHTLAVKVAASLEGEAPRAMVIETDDPEVWVSATQLDTDGNTWNGVSQLYDNRESPHEVNLEGLRITLLTNHAAVDIQGCTLP